MQVEPESRFSFIQLGGFGAQPSVSIQQVSNSGLDPKMLFNTMKTRSRKVFFAFV